MITYSKCRVLKIGLLYGLAAGILGGVNAVTSAALIGKVGEELIFYVVIFGIAALAVASGLIAARISGRSLTGLWVGLLVGLIAAVIATAARAGFTVAFYNLVRHDPVEIRDWMHRGSATFKDYLVADRIGGFINTTLSFGVICGVCGILGGWFNSVRASFARRQVSS